MEQLVDPGVVAGRLRELRRERKWSAQRLADACALLDHAGLTRGTIAKIESNRRGVSAQEVAVLAQALEVAPEQLTSSVEQSGRDAQPSSRPREQPGRRGLTILHLSDLQFSPGEPGKVFGADNGPWQPVLEDLCACLQRQLPHGFGKGVDLVVISGGLTIGGKPGEFDVARDFLESLTRRLGIGFDRVAVVPGNHDVNLAACRAYFSDCEADDMKPLEPYWPKWRHFTKLFHLWPDQGAQVRIEAEQPWSKFEIADLSVVVAGLNSTIRDSHLRADQSGSIGQRQADWFAAELDGYRERGWLRIGVVHHNPLGQAGLAAENLGDAALLDVTVGPMLNLLMHGHGDSVNELPSSGVPALGAGSAAVAAGLRPPTIGNRAELVRIDENGLIRVQCQYDVALGRWQAEGPIRQLRQWESVHAAFPDPSGNTPSIVRQRPPTQWPETAGQPESHGLDARRTLLDSIADVCQVRYADATVRRIDGHPPYLRVTYLDGDVARQIRIGAEVGRFDRPQVDAFLARVHGQDSSELIYHGPEAEPSDALIDYARRRGVTLRSFTQFQGLLNLNRYVADQTARLTMDPLYPPAGYVPHRFTDLSNATRPVREDLVGELLRTLAADQGRFLLLLGDFGRGKTFSLRELARRIPKELPGRIPILIELRSLDKAHSIEGLVAAHLANHQQEQIDITAFKYMLRHGLIVLIFDGFDELAARATFGRAAEHLRKILEAAEGKAKIVVASRTQHFQTHAQVQNVIGDLGGLPQRRIFNIEELSPTQVRSVLIQRYDGDAEAADRRIELMKRVGGLSTLASNPRMLGFIADLREEQLRTVVSSRGTVSAAALYLQILTSWLEYEATRTQGIIGAPVGLDVADLWVAVTQLAIRLWDSDLDEINLTELGEFAQTLDGLAAGHLSSDQITHAVGAGSLLRRNDDGMFSFIHSSVAEWLVAKRVSDQLAVGGDVRRLLETRPLSAATVDFISGLADPRLCRAWIRSVRENPEATEAARTNASYINARLSSDPQADMHQAILSGQDLSLWSFVGADLSEAELIGTQLTDADLTGANLRGAKLNGAILDGAILHGADLTDADLSGAQLTRTKLTDAKLDRSLLARARLVGADLTGVSAQDTKWRRAAMVSVEAEPELLEQARRLGAAVVPGQRVESATLPARVGVRFGFEEGRLPRPVSFDFEGGLLAIGNEDGTVLVCDAETSQPLRTLIGHEDRAYAVVFSPKGPVLATGSLDRTIRLWDADTGECLSVLEGMSGWVWPMMFSPDGTLLAVGDDAATIRIWDVTSGEQRARFQSVKAPIWTAAFDPSLRYLAVADDGKGARVWDISSQAVAFELDTEDSVLYWLRFNRAGTALAGAGKDGTIRVWDPETGRLRHRLTGHAATVYAFDFDSAGDLIVSADTDGTVLSWDLRMATPVAKRLPPHSGAVYRITFSPAGKYFATGDSDGAVRLWDAASQTIHYDLPPHHASVWPMMFRADGNRLVTSSNDFTTKIWDTYSGALVSTITGHERSVWSAAFSGDGSMMATTAKDGRVRLWEVRTGRLLRTIELPVLRLISAVFCSSPKDPLLLATATNDGQVRLWEANTGREGRHLPIQTEDVWSVVFSPDGDLVAAATDENTVNIIFRKTNRTRTTLSEHRGRVRGLAFSPDGKELATAGDDSVIRVWDWDRATVNAAFEGHSGRIHALAFHPQLPELTSVGTDGKLITWDLENMVAKRTVDPGQGSLWSVVYHPDGTLMATAGDSGIIEIWDARTGAHLRRLTGHLSRVWSLAFSPDGSLMASSSNDGKVVLWSVAGDRIDDIATLIGMQTDEWVAFTPDGRHKGHGEHAVDFWHVVGMSRFEAGELDHHIPDVRRVDVDEPLF